jgi:hypothetical protein
LTNPFRGTTSIFYRVILEFRVRVNPLSILGESSFCGTCDADSREPEKLNSDQCDPSQW